MGPKGPTDGAEGCNPPQKLEKAREAGYFSSIVIFLTITTLLSANLTMIAIHIDSLPGPLSLVFLRLLHPKLTTLNNPISNIARTPDLESLLARLPVQPHHIEHVPARLLGHWRLAAVHSRLAGLLLEPLLLQVLHPDGRR